MSNYIKGDKVRYNGKIYTVFQVLRNRELIDENGKVIMTTDILGLVDENGRVEGQFCGYEVEDLEMDKMETVKWLAEMVDNAYSGCAVPKTVGEAVDRLIFGGIYQ